MRRIERRQVSLAARQELARRAEHDGTTPVRVRWNRYRGSAAAREVIATLRVMAGARERCMYCSDSRGTDVEHFRPISVAPELAFVWSNMLWICTECNRKKGGRFPTAPDGRPLLLDPTRTDPWSVLFLDAATGVLAPRYLPDGEPHPVGATTLRTLDNLNDEPLIEARHRQLRRATEAMAQAAEHADDPHARTFLLREARHDDLGIFAWLVRSDGAGDPQPAALRAAAPEAWRRLTDLVVGPGG